MLDVIEEIVDNALDTLWERGLLSNFLQGHGLSGRGTRDELKEVARPILVELLMWKEA